MTIDERFARIEHVTAGLVEERQKDREDARQLWRDTQRQLNELSVRVVQMGEEMHYSDMRLERRIAQLAEEARAEDKRLGERIESLASALGEFLAKDGKQQGGEKWLSWSGVERRFRVRRLWGKLRVVDRAG